MARNPDVVVVGGGVVGAAAALALQRERLDVVLLERGAAPAAFDPAAEVDARVYAIAPGTVRFLESLGVWRRVAAQRASPYRRMQVWETDPAQGLHFDVQGAREAQLGFIVEDRVLRSALWEALGNARVETGIAPRGFDYDGRARLELEDARCLEADLVVAAEGADSPLREWAGIDAGGWDYAQRAIVCHVGTALPHEQTAWQRFLPGGPLAFLPLADGRSSIVWSVPQDQASRLLGLNDAEFGAELEQAFQSRLGRITSVTRRQSFPLRMLHAERYAVPGLVLAGDSAHVVHPLAGQGVNLGLADVAALARVLSDARAQGRPWTLRVLKRYERQRRADNVEMLVLTDGLSRLFGQGGPALRALREAGLFLVDRLDPIKRPLARRAMGV